MRTVSLSDEDWDAIVKAVLDHTEVEAKLGFEADAKRLLLLSSRLVEALEAAREPHD